MRYTRRDFFTQFGRSLLTHVARSVETVQAGISHQMRVKLVRSGGLHGEESGGRPDESMQAEPRKWLRPPGALPEASFRSTCTQCEDCIQACPYDSIRHLGPESGINAGTPAIDPDISPCYLCEDMPCITVCEPRALIPVKRKDVAMGMAVLKRIDCNLTRGEPCDLCVTQCPIGSDAIKFDVIGLPIIHAAGCAGCGVCSHLCPAGAITVTRVADTGEAGVADAPSQNQQRTTQI